jgi:integrase
MNVRYYEKRPGAWHLDFRSPDGRRLRPYGGTTEAEARRAAPGVIAKALAGPAVPEVPALATVPLADQPRAGMTFAQAFKKGMRERPKWIQAKDKITIKQTYDQVAAYWGADSDLGKVTREAVKDWRAAMLEEDGKREGTKLSPSTINHRMSMLNVLMEVADVAPHGVKFLSVEGNRRSRRTRAEELQAMAAWCITNHARKGALLLADLITVGLNTAARKSELTGLEWADVYFDLKQLRFRDTKNGTHRVIPVSEVVMRVLERRKEAGEPAPFAGVGKWQLGALWRDARTALGLGEDEEFVFHVATRHEGLSRLGDQGASAFQIKAMSGHKAITAADRYVRPEVESLRALAEGINK